MIFPWEAPAANQISPKCSEVLLVPALDLLESATGPRTTMQTSFTWWQGDDWKAKIFSQEQPWKDEESQKEWLAKKELYRQLKKEGKI